MFDEAPQLRSGARLAERLVTRFPHDTTNEHVATLEKSGAREHLTANISFDMNSNFHLNVDLQQHSKAIFFSSNTIFLLSDIFKLITTIHK